MQLNQNELAISDNIAILLKYAKQKFAPEVGQELIDNALAKIADDTTNVTDAQAVDAGFDVVIEVATEAGAPKVAKLFTDIKKTADDAEAGKSFFVEVADGGAIIADLHGLKSTPKTTETANTGSEGAE